MNDFQVKDSGARQEFESGMRRDTEDGKPNFLLALDGPMHERYAIHMTKGAAKYGEGNWQNANSKVEYDRFRRSAYRHLRQWLRGERDEDHASAVIFNLNAAEFVRDKALTAGYCVETEAGDVWLEPIRPQAEPQVADCRTVEEPPVEDDPRKHAAELVGLAGTAPGALDDLREERDLQREREERLARDPAAGLADPIPNGERPRHWLESDMPSLKEQEARSGLRPARSPREVDRYRPGYDT